MITFESQSEDFADAAGESIVQDSVAAHAFDFVATPLPVFRKGEAAGIALAYAPRDTETCDEDRFTLLVVDSAGEVLSRLGPFTEEDVVAVWRDLAVKSGLPRMLLRDGGGLSIVSHQIGRLALGKTRQRRRHGLLNGRRPRFLVRRKSSRLPARPQVYRGENEIIARS